jgi:hypothetical protein
MNRLKFLAFLLPSFLFAQSKVNKNQIKINDNVGAVPLQDVKLLGNYGASEFLEIRLGTGLSAQMKTVGTESFIEIVNTANTQLYRQQILRATRQSNNRYFIEVPPPGLSNRELTVFYNGMFQTPVEDFTRDGDTAVIFKEIIPENAVITFVYSGI